MKILVVGTGVIGCIYGWQLSEAGYEVTHFVRRGRKSEIDKNGIIIHCLDARKQNRLIIEILYRPNTVEQIDNNRYDLIIVPTKANQLNSILPILAKTEKDMSILLLQNLWITHIRQIESAFQDSKIIYGQAHIAGGGKSGNKITCVIFGSKNAPTMLGKKDGTVSESVLQVEKIMRQANLNPKISKNIFGWLISHYVEANGLVAGVMEARTAQKYVSNKKYIKHSIRLIREGFKICTLLGIHARRIYPQALYYLPTWCLVPALLKMYRTEETQLMIQGHIKHSPDEMKEMFYDVFETGKDFGLSMKNYKQMQRYIDKFLNTILFIQILTVLQSCIRLFHPVC